MQNAFHNILPKHTELQVKKQKRRHTITQPLGRRVFRAIKNPSILSDLAKRQHVRLERTTNPVIIAGLKALAVCSANMIRQTNTIWHALHDHHNDIPSFLITFSFRNYYIQTIEFHCIAADQLSKEPHTSSQVQDSRLSGKWEGISKQF
ncbi:unnamed protein product [Clavelina lepadiformis]|uniref:Uncharacterized protein n=1 Tax=Clavelina lepadiformis TaxID=159417 RepID=A0ABP0GNX2_CLALP